MSNQNILRLKELRHRIPIGIQRGLELLEKNDGNVNEVERIFKQEVLSEAVKITGVDKEVAFFHLSKCKFDLHLAINSINEERYFFTERTLKKFSSDKFTALERIVGEVECQENLQRGIDYFWYDINHLVALQPEVYTLVLIMEWLDYEDYEGLDYALNFHIEEIKNQISNTLLLNEVAETLKQAEIIYKKQVDKRDNKITEFKMFEKTNKFKELESILENQKLTLINRLYEFVEKHLDKFPK